MLSCTGLGCCSSIRASSCTLGQWRIYTYDCRLLAFIISRDIWCHTDIGVITRDRHDGHVLVQCPVGVVPLSRCETFQNCRLMLKVDIDCRIVVANRTSYIYVMWCCDIAVLSIYSLVLTFRDGRKGHFWGSCLDEKWAMNYKLVIFTFLESSSDVADMLTWLIFAHRVFRFSIIKSYSFSTILWILN